MKLHDAWKRMAYDTKGGPVKHAWDEYMAKEKEVYKRILREKVKRSEGSMEELAAAFGLSPVHMAAFIDGIHECVDNLPVVEDLEETTAVVVEFDWQRLYKQMVEYKAEELYTLEEWENIFTKEEQKQFYTEQKKSHTIVRNEEKIGRNDPCPCGSGKKYKKCCGLTA